MHTTAFAMAFVLTAAGDEPRLHYFARVVDAVSGEPVAGAELLREPAASTDPAQPLVLLARSDAEGNAVVEFTDSQPFAVRVQAADYGRALLVVRGGSHPSADVSFQVALDEGATCRGELRDADGKPLPDVEVALAVTGDMIERGEWLTLDESLGTQYEVATVRTATDGSFRFAGLPSGTNAILTARSPLFAFPMPCVTHPNLAAPTRGGSRHETDFVSWSLPRALTLTGRVFAADGTPASGAEVECQAASTVADEDGGFELHGLMEGPEKRGAWSSRSRPRNAPPPEREKVGVYARSRDGLELVRQEVDLNDKTPSSSVELRLRKGVRVRGRTVGSDLAPLACVPLVFLHQPSKDIGGTTTSTQDGTFEFAGLETRPGLVLIDRLGAWAGRAAVESDFSSEVVVRCVPLPGFSGTLVDVGSGRPVADAWVVARNREGGSKGVPADARGFAVLALEAGVWDLVAATDDGRIATLEGVELKEGERRDGIVLRLERGAWIDAHVISGQGKDATRWIGRAPSFDLTARRGPATVAEAPLYANEDAELLVPAGEITLELGRAGNARPVKVKVRAGESLAVALRLGK